SGDPGLVLRGSSHTGKIGRFARRHCTTPARLIVHAGASLASDRRGIAMPATYDAGETLVQSRRLADQIARELEATSLWRPTAKRQLTTGTQRLAKTASAKVATAKSAAVAKAKRVSARII